MLEDPRRALSDPSAVILALDIGGTKVAAGVVDRDGRVVAQRSMPTSARADSEGLLAELVALARAVLGAADAGRSVGAIGVGCGGPMVFPEGVVSPLHIPAWRGFPLRARLEAEFSLPCSVDNDAKAMALGESWRGAGRGSRHMLGMVVSTGVGGGIVREGTLVDGAHGNAGHIGHVVVRPGGPDCECGARGCAGTLASGSGIAARAREAARGSEPTLLRDRLSAADVAVAARAGDAVARRLFHDAGTALGLAIAAAQVLLDLDRVVVGGGVALGAWDLLAAPLEYALRDAARLSFARDLPVVRASLGARAGIVGAAALALRPGAPP
ncbi:MAG: ROK family protein [Candidatus Limnocylindria bacterium]